MTTLEREVDRCRRAAQEAPEDLDVLLASGMVCLRRDLRLEALQIFQAVLEAEPRAEARLGLAQVFARQQHFVEAYGELRRLFELDPVNVQGHALLLWLSQREPVPDDLQAHLAFVPSRNDLVESRAALEAERDLLAGEVDQYRAVSSGPDPEPIYIYHLEESRRRVERVLETLEFMEGWEKLALEILPAAPPPQEVPEPVAPAEEQEQEALPEEPPRAQAAHVSEAAQTFYAGITLNLAEVLERLGKTRGVKGSLLLADDFGMVWQVGFDSNISDVLAAVTEGLALLRGYRDGLRHWVLEWEGGLAVAQRVDEHHFMVVVGKGGVNFGVLRYAIEKCRPEIAAMLADRRLV